MDILGAKLEERSLIVAAIALCFVAITYLALSQGQRETIINRLRIRGRRASSAGTPPRSLSPEKKVLNNVPPRNEYADIFPLNQRDALAKVAERLPVKQREALGDLKFDQKKMVSNLLKYRDDYLKCDESMYIASGISIKEVKALGDFPDYAELSGVPLPEPYPEFDINKALPRPYRPFRWAYHQTMSLIKLEPDWWLELEKSYKSRIKQRKALYEQYDKAVVAWLPGSELACKEVMEIGLQFLCARYAHCFELGADKRTFTNRILGTKQDVREKHPLLVLLDNIPEDFALMLRNPDDGLYYLRAGIICSALGWNIGTKIGMALHQIHAPIPDYIEKMQFSMDRFFTKMPTHRPIQRGSWGLEVDQPLYMPPGDPHEKIRDIQSTTLTPSTCHLRVDWQTLRRLPLSGAVCFNFKAVFTPLTEFRDEPYIPSLILKVLTEGKEKIMEYKNTWHVEHVVLPTLRAYEHEQREKGLVEMDWEVQTLEESPWFPGWREKWKGMQGF